MSKQKLLEELGMMDNEEFKLSMLETIGNLVLMSHWMRGIVDALIRENNIALTYKQRKNWDRVVKDLELYEEFTWEIAPARAMLIQLRNFRVTGELEENFTALSNADTHGRVAYGLDNKTLDDIEDIIRRIKDARQATGCSGYGHASALLGNG